LKPRKWIKKTKKIKRNQGNWRTYQAKPRVTRCNHEKSKEHKETKEQMAMGVQIIAHIQIFYNNVTKSRYVLLFTIYTSRFEIGQW